MTRSTLRRRGAARKSTFIPCLRPIAAACWGLLFVAGAAYAQQAPADTESKEDKKAREQAEAVDKFTVTGIRRSIESSVATKRNSDSIVESISAEDIGKLPDISIGESLARLPGLAGQRVDGRAQVISIRGLSPDFAATLLNGREQVSTGDNRGVEFDQYPSELLQAVTVYKTPDGALIGQGLSGTIDMQTIRPLDFRGRRLNLNVRGESNSLGKQNANGESKGNRLSATYIDQFAANTIGVALGFAHLDSPFQEQHYKAWWWANTTPWGAPPNGKPADATALMGAEVWAKSKTLKRDGLMGVLEYKPNAGLHSVVDLYYSKFDQKDTMRGLMWDSSPWTGNNVGYLNPVTTLVGTDPLVTGGTYTNLKPVVRNDYNTRNDTLSALGWNTKLDLADKWTAIADLSYSSAKRDERVLETYAGATTLDNFRFNIPTGPGFPTFTPGLNYADPATVVLSDPAGWGHDGRLETPSQKDTLKSMRLTGRRDLDGIFSAIDAGVNYASREKVRESTVYFANLLNSRAPVTVGSNYLVSPTSLDFAGIPGVLGYDVLGTLGRYYTLTEQMSTDDFKKNFKINEKVTTAFTRISIDTEAGKVPIRGNLGVQYVHTDQSSSAYNIDSGSGAVVGNLERGTAYNDMLPSLNLIADLGDGMLARFGLAKTLARARIDDLRASASAGVDPTSRTWSGSGGNPTLQPWRAKSADLSFEKYFGKRSYVALAGYYKRLDTYIYSQTLPFDFTGFVNTSTVTPLSNIGTMSSPANGNGGTLSGVELSAAVGGEVISPLLDGFGVQVSGSDTYSKIKPDGPDSSLTMTLPGLSKRVSNVTLYYEKAGFSARASERYRSDFRGEITSIFAQRSYTRILSDKQTDLQVGYEIRDGRFRGLGVLFQVNNATNSPYRTVQDGNFAGGVVAPQEYNLYGRQFLLGVNYKL